MSKSRAWSKKYLHRRVFTERNLYAQKLLRREYTEKSLHTETLTHRCLYGAQRLLHRGTFTPRLHKKVHKRIYTQKPLRTEIFTNIFFHREVFIQKNFHPQTLLHTKPLRTKNALRNFCASHLCVSICPPLRFNLSILSEI